MRVAIAGAAGRMGRALIEACETADGVVCAAALERPGHDALGVDAGTLAGGAALGCVLSAELAAIAADFDVLVEFTLPEPTVEHLRQCVALDKPMVIGTTGLNEEQRGAIKAASEHIPIVFAPNMSIGVNLTFKLIEVAAKALGDSADIEVIEAHHRHKVDAPSGTAVRMGEILANTLGRDLGECAVYGREGRTGPRDRRTIGFETVRGGDIVGDHTVMFATEGERIEITHRSHTRANFAHGALRAAAWLASQSAGVYDMQDVLGFRH
ncbi:MAG: 4-hydroxy-tetrahydrodipicolinate reductase [Gammaproteobacteria bacterium]|nr:4-hydroxy-tetrahydrodipicolinate reductase [Gammaproteobacteria bacterium]